MTSWRRALSRDAQGDEDEDADTAVGARQARPLVHCKYAAPRRHRGGTLAVRLGRLGLGGALCPPSSLQRDKASWCRLTSPTSFPVLVTSG